MKKEQDLILVDHFKNLRELLLRYSKFVGSANHKVITGTAREVLLANFLSNNLPETVKYQTGEIFNHLGERSGQIDIVLHNFSTLKLNLFGAINLFPVENVLGAIEVKTVITTDNKYPDTCFVITENDLNKISEKINDFTNKELELKKLVNILFKDENDFKVELEKIFINDQLSISQIFKISDKSKSNSILFEAFKSCENVKKLNIDLPFIVFAFSGCKLDTMLEKINNYVNYYKLENSTSFAYCRLPDLIVVLEEDYCLEKLDCRYNQKYIEHKSDSLIQLFKYINEKSKVWNNSKKEFQFEKYTKLERNLDDFFKF